MRRVPTPQSATPHPDARRHRSLTDALPIRWDETIVLAQPEPRTLRRRWSTWLQMNGYFRKRREAGFL